MRSVLGCQAESGVCRACYGHDLSTRSLVRLGVAVGIIAAQSIGEPSTQLTMRTFHTGGVAGVSDITQGLPRVEELFEARVPREAAIISEIAGTVEITQKQEEYTVYVIAPFVGAVSSPCLQQAADTNALIPVDGTNGSHEQERRLYTIAVTRKLAVNHGQQITAGTPLTTGPLNPEQVLRILGKQVVQQYLVSEVSTVYRNTGVYIHDKHFEVIVREMLRHVVVEESGDTRLLPGDILDRFKYADINAHVLAAGGMPAMAGTLLLGLTRTALVSDSWLAAASFQETTRVLADAALAGKTDSLASPKGNVIIGRLIPVGTGFRPQPMTKR